MSHPNLGNNIGQTTSNPVEQEFVPERYPMRPPRHHAEYVSNVPTGMGQLQPVMNHHYQPPTNQMMQPNYFNQSAMNQYHGMYQNGYWQPTTSSNQWTQPHNQWDQAQQLNTWTSQHQQNGGHYSNLGPNQNTWIPQQYQYSGYYSEHGSNSNNWASQHQQNEGHYSDPGWNQGSWIHQNQWGGQNQFCNFPTYPANSGPVNQTETIYPLAGNYSTGPQGFVTAINGSGDGFEMADLPIDHSTNHRPLEPENSQNNEQTLETLHYNACLPYLPLKSIRNEVPVVQPIQIGGYAVVIPHVVGPIENVPQQVAEEHSNDQGEIHQDAVVDVPIVEAHESSSESGPSSPVQLVQAHEQHPKNQKINKKKNKKNKKNTNSNPTNAEKRAAEAADRKSLEEARQANQRAMLEKRAQLRLLERYLNVHRNMRVDLYKFDYESIAFTADECQTALLEWFLKNKKTNWKTKKREATKILEERLAVHSESNDQLKKLRCLILLENMNDVIVQDILAMRETGGTFSSSEQTYLDTVFNENGPNVNMLVIPKTETIQEDQDEEQISGNPEWSVSELKKKLNTYIARQKVIRNKDLNYGNVNWKSPLEKSLALQYLVKKGTFLNIKTKNEDFLLNEYKCHWKTNRLIATMSTLAEKKSKSLFLADRLFGILLEATDEILLFDVFGMVHMVDEKVTGVKIAHDYLHLVFDFVSSNGSVELSTEL